MTSQHDKPKRWRPRFSVRTLAIVVTLVCCYAACWGPTKSRGVSDVELDAEESLLIAAEATSVAPLVVVVQGYQLKLLWGRTRVMEDSPYRRRYYFWFFGYVAKLPYERELLPGFVSTFSGNTEPAVLVVSLG